MSSGWPYEMWPGGPPPGAHLQSPVPPSRRLTPEQERRRGEQLNAFFRARDRWAARGAETLVHTTNPIARLAIAIRACIDDRDGYAPVGSELTIRADIPMLEVLLPDTTWNQATLRGQGWDHDAIAQWFMSAVKVAPNCPNLLFGYVPLLGAERRRPAWGFHWGSSRIRQTDSTQSFCWVGISTKGERLFDSVGRRTVPVKPGEGFNALALAAMADFAKLPDLRDKPQFPR